ncbi:MAG: hypothetical protein JRJ45_00420 [Deltaproteobacteria bacterium]|nr:hypothetical protein [Deltaproteobacteria bacterium]
MKRRDFLKALGFTIAASACHSRLILGKSVPVPYEDDGHRIHYSDDGYRMVKFNHGAPRAYCGLTEPYDNSSAKDLPWPDEVKHLLES